jgi:hypothetical protein
MLARSLAVDKVFKLVLPPVHGGHRCREIRPGV